MVKRIIEKEVKRLTNEKQVAKKEILILIDTISYFAVHNEIAMPDAENFAEQLFKKMEGEKIIY